MYDIHYMKNNFIKIDISNNKFINKYLQNTVLLYKNNNEITKGKITINNNRYVKFDEFCNNKSYSFYMTKHKFAYCDFYLPREFWKIHILKESLDNNIKTVYLNLNNYVSEFL
tara:strand:+ start:3997 stop:4335 length:339 start_codon:yes stop_codon:yes gene_type:complete